MYGEGRLCAQKKYASAILDVPKNTNKALNCMLRNYTELTNCIDFPDMPLDNNDTERLIRDMAMGRSLTCSVETWMLAGVLP